MPASDRQSPSQLRAAGAPISAAAPARPPDRKVTAPSGMCSSSVCLRFQRLRARAGSREAGQQGDGGRRGLARARSSNVGRTCRPLGCNTLRATAGCSFTAQLHLTAALASGTRTCSARCCSGCQRWEHPNSWGWRKVAHHCTKKHGNATCLPWPPSHLRLGIVLSTSTVLPLRQRVRRSAHRNAGPGLSRPTVEGRA